jgi:hypothetical protein
MFKQPQRAVLGFAALVLAGLSGCALMDSHERVAGWPELKIVEHHVSNPEMRDRCAPYVGPLMSPQGCTLFFLDRREAHIYVSKDFPSAAVLEHERLHAAGYDHVGSLGMDTIVRDWKARTQRQVAAGPEAFDSK